MSDIFASWRWEYLLNDKQIFIDAFLVTLKVSIVGLILALILGVIVGLMSTSQQKILKGISRVYVEFFQNTPLVLQVLFMYYGFTFAGFAVEKQFVGIIGIGIYTAAYISEVVRTGITSIHKGQYEAAESQGFGYGMTMQYIILPQTIKIILPPLTNQMVILVKNSSVLTMIAGGDLIYATNAWASNGTLSYGPAYLVCGAMFFIICFPLTTFAYAYEQKVKARDKRKNNSIKSTKGVAA